MKAIDYYNKLVAAETDEGLETALVNCLNGLSQEANRLIKIRKATSNDAVRKCVLQVNDTWVAIVNLYEKNKDKLDPATPLAKRVLVKDGFKAAYVELNPKRRWFFDIKEHQTRMEIKQKELDIKGFEKGVKELESELGQDLTDPNLILFGLITYAQWDEIGFDANKLRMEFLKGAYTLSKINSTNEKSIGLKMYYMKTIAHYMHNLQAWLAIGKIDTSFKNLSTSEVDKTLREKYNLSVSFN